MSGWTVVVPVRGGSGKSRLDVPDVDRASLARAIGWDTIAAVRACPLVDRVLVVTADGPLAADLPPGCRHVRDPGSGLNAAVRAGLDAADPRVPRAAILGDLPALRATELAIVLQAALAHAAAALPDADGTGTALLTRTAVGALEPAFGEDSFARHRAAGFTDLRESLAAGPPASTVRRDVDTVEHLYAAAALGLGIRTAAVLAPAGIVGAGPAQEAASPLE